LIISSIIFHRSIFIDHIGLLGLLGLLVIDDCLYFIGYLDSSSILPRFGTWVL